MRHQEPLYRRIGFPCGKGALEEVQIRFRVYSGPPGAEDVGLAKDQQLFKEFTTLDEALLWAKHLEKKNHVPLLIEGDDGTRMDRREIVNALRVGAREDIGASATR